MQNTLSQYLNSLSTASDRAALRAILKPIYDRLSCQVTASAGLVIKAATSALAKTGAVAFQAFVKGIPVTIAAATDMPALVGSITANSFNVYAFFIDTASVVTVAMGTEGTTLKAVKFPPIPEGKTVVGYLIVTHTATFIGGTTALDVGGAVVNFVSPMGAFDPTALIG